MLKEVYFTKKKNLNLQDFLQFFTKEFTKSFCKSFINFLIFRKISNYLIYLELVALYLQMINQVYLIHQDKRLHHFLILFYLR